MSLSRPRLPLTIAMTLSACALLHADDFVFSRFGDYLEALRVQAGIPGLAAAIVGPNDVLWERAFGHQDVERNVATRLDTPFQLDGTTQIVVASRALRCAEEGSLSLDDLVAKFQPTSPDAGATMRQLLTHTSAGPAGLTFAYRPERIAPIAAPIGECTRSTFRYGVAELLDRFSMVDTVPGADAAQLTAPAERFTASTLQRYASVIGRLATPYTVGAANHATPSSYVAQTLTPASGLISTVRDLERFDLALKDGAVISPAALEYAWTPPNDGGGRPLPHAYGYFVQTYNGEKLVWQFGVSDNASSSMIITLPWRGMTLIMLANSQGLVRPLPLAAGDVTVSPFARLFLSIFAVR
jgi:CubicO group peptidase (beta-lactamase class C family)